MRYECSGVEERKPGHIVRTIIKVVEKVSARVISGWREQGRETENSQSSEIRLKMRRVPSYQLPALLGSVLMITDSHCREGVVTSLA